MLERSKQDLAGASPSELHVSEILARCYLTAELEENLIPTQEAERIVDARRGVEDETWLRAVHAALMGLRVAKQSGYKLTEPSTVT